MVWLVAGKNTRCWCKLNIRTKGSGKMKANMSTLIALLTGMFTGAKLANAISWSWWLVFSPVLIYYGFWIAFWVVMAIISLTWSFIDGFKEEWRKQRNKHED